MANSLSQVVYQQTERSFPPRLYDSLKSIWTYEGPLTALATTVTHVASTILSITFTYFCAEGAVRSFIELAEDRTPVIFLRPLGDVGGWISLCLFSTLALKKIMESLVRQGEYLELKLICEKYIADHQNTEDSSFLNHVYPEIHQLLDSFNSRCLFSKQHVTRKINALEACETIHSIQKKSKHEQDSKVKNVLTEINSKLEKKLSFEQYSQRVYKGQKAINEKGYLAGVITVVFGIAIPLIFIANTIFSIVGEVGLGAQLFHNRTDLADTGHFGEWPINAIEALSVAYLLHLWYLLNEGDLRITKKVYATEITKQNDTEIHNRLCTIANKEMSEMSTVCHYLKYPHEINFKKL
jgi:hypothetical protein